MKMEERTFRIGDLAKEVGVERFVIRFWEKEFAIESRRSSGGQRFFTERDCALFKTIKELLYIRKLTIAGAKEALQSGNGFMGATRANTHTTPHTNTKDLPKTVIEQLQLCNQQLRKLRELL